jgi:uncharacterized protein DUF4232
MRHKPLVGSSRGATTLRLCLSGLLLLTGCGSDSSAQSTQHGAPSQPVSASRSSTTGTTMSRTSPAVERPSRCSTKQLKIAVVGFRAGGAGHSGYVLRFKNAGRPCTLQGFPGVDGLAVNGRVVVHARRSRRGYLGGAHSRSRISLPTGATASALLEGLTGPIRGHPCPQYRSLMITPPNETHSERRRAGVYPLCDPEIHPVVTGRRGTNLTYLTESRSDAHEPSSNAAG